MVYIRVCIYTIQDDDDDTLIHAAMRDGHYIYIYNINGCMSKSSSRNGEIVYVNVVVSKSPHSHICRRCIG